MKLSILHIFLDTFSFLLAGLLFSCGHSTSYPEELVRADSLLRLDPAQADSALLLLERFKTKRSETPEPVDMFYNLLKIKAEDKIYVKHESDSLMLRIVRYYEEEGNDKLLPEAYYYLGSVYRDMQDAPHALDAFQRSLDLKNSHRDYTLVGRTYNQMGMLLGHQSLYEVALPLLDSAKYYYQKINNQSGVAFVLRDIGRMYDMLHRQDSAELYYRQSYDKAVALDNLFLTNNIGHEFANYYLDQNKLDAAKSILSCIAGSENDAINQYILGLMWLKENHEDSALYYFQKALAPERINQISTLCEASNHELAKIKAGRGDYRTAWDYEQASRQWADSIKRVTRTETVGRIHALYNYQHIEKKNQQLLAEQAHDRFWGLVGTVIFLLCLCAGILYLYIMQRKQHTLERQQQQLKEEMQRQAENSQQAIEENLQKIDRLNREIAEAQAKNDLLSEQNAEIHKQYLEAKNIKLRLELDEQQAREEQLYSSEIYLYFCKQAEEGKSVPMNRAEWKILEENLNSTYPEFTRRLTRLCADISPLELHTCYLIKLKFQVTDIACLLSRSKSGITNLRTRLYEKITGKKGKPQQMDQLISDL